MSGWPATFPAQHVAGERRLRAGALVAAMRLALASLIVFALGMAGAPPAAALKPITLTGDQDWIDLTMLGEIYEGRGDQMQIETAPSADGATARMAVRAATPGSNPGWLVFALSNPTQKAIELWLSADRYSPIGSGVMWPDLDARRITAVTHSAGYAPERLRNDRTDIFRLTVERGQTVTFAAELASDRVSRINLWKPIEFEQRQRERQLFNGIMLGISGLLAVFLTAVFAAHHKSIFPSAGLVAWCALALLCVDFGFWHKLFQMRPEDNAQYRAVAEAALAASLVIFLAAFLRVTLWSSFARTLFVVWIAAQLAVIAVAVVDPRLAATLARLSFGVIGVVGMLLILALSLRGLDRALALMPTWILLMVWLFGGALTFSGRMSGEFAISGLVSGLVLIVVLIGFTVTQYAFRSGEPMLGAGAGGQQLRLAAMDRAGAAFWEWNVRRDELRLDPEMEAALGLGAGELPTKIDDLLGYLHPADRERFRLELLAIRERDGGTLHTGIRVRHADSSYRWLDFEGASVPTSDRRNMRCVGLVRDTTDAKRAQERLLHNAVYDSLTSLPNRELFLDRLGNMLGGAGRAAAGAISVMVIDVDKFRSVNASFGIVVGDSIILTVSKRIARILGETGNLARVGGDQFALFIVGPADANALGSVAERLRLSLRSPIRIAGQEVVLTSSIGIAISDGVNDRPRDLLRDAEVAMHRAKRRGSDRAEIFTREMLTERAERAELERDLALAITSGQLTLLYQPIVALANDELIGLDAVVRWQHPRLGVIAPGEFMALVDGSDVAVKLVMFVLGRATRDLARWHQELPRPEHPLFVTVGFASRRMLVPELVQEIRQLRSGNILPPGSLRLSFPETLVTDNPEQASHVLAQLRDAGIELWMDRFGSGYSSLAYLGKFPFETFKIDKALVEWCSQGQRDAAMVRSLVAVAHELGRQVAADGVETLEDAAYLRSIGCHYAQGFQFGEAMPEPDVVRLLRLIKKSERRMRRRGMVRGQDKRKGGELAPEASPSPSMPSPVQPVPVGASSRQGGALPTAIVGAVAQAKSGSMPGNHPQRQAGSLPLAGGLAGRRAVNGRLADGRVVATDSHAPRSVPVGGVPPPEARPAFGNPTATPSGPPTGPAIPERVRERTVPPNAPMPVSPSRPAAMPPADGPAFGQRPDVPATAAFQHSAAGFPSADPMQGVQPASAAAGAPDGRGAPTLPPVAAAEPPTGGRPARPDLSSLSPAVAASLARLAGKANRGASQAASDGENTGGQGAESGIKAAE